MKKLAVFFPGIGYTVDKPLLHYSRKLVTDAGYEVKLLPYSGFPQKVKGDRDKMLESYRIALAQSEEMLSGIDFSDYYSVLFVGKSIGTIVAAEIKESHTRTKSFYPVYTVRRHIQVPDWRRNCLHRQCRSLGKEWRHI